MVTPRRVAVIMVCVFGVLVCSVAPVYVVNRLDLKLLPGTNTTILGLVFAKNRGEVEKISYSVNNVFVPFSAFAVILACTFTLVIKLRNTGEWRKKSATSTQAENISLRNQKLAKMVLAISCIFISCFTPISIAFVAMSLEHSLSIDGINRNLLTVIAGFSLLLESVNSSVNIFIYYKMSSKYRATFHQLLQAFCDRKKAKKSD